MWEGAASLRRIETLIYQLPHNSALHRALDPDQWGVEHYLLANVIDVLQAANWQRGYNPKNPAPRPQPHPRPGVVSEEDRYAAMAEAEMERRRNRKG